MLILLGIAIAAILVLSILHSDRADRQRIEAEEEARRYRDLLAEVIQSSRDTSAAEEKARDSMNQLLKFKKKEIKRLKAELADMHELIDEADEEEGDDNEEEAPAIQDTLDVADISLALQRKLRLIRMEAKDAIENGREIDKERVMQLSDSSLQSIQDEGK